MLAGVNPTQYVSMMSCICLYQCVSLGMDKLLVSPYQWRSFCYYSSLSLCFIQWIQHNMSPWCHTNVSLYDQTVCIAIPMSLWWSHWRYSSLSLCFLERIQHNMSLWWTAYVSIDMSLWHNWMYHSTFQCWPRWIYYCIYGFMKTWLSL